MASRLRALAAASCELADFRSALGEAAREHLLARSEDDLERTILHLRRLLRVLARRRARLPPARFCAAPRAAPARRPSVAARLSERREALAREATCRLALLLCQRGSGRGAAARLLARAGFVARLSADVLRYPTRAPREDDARWVAAPAGRLLVVDDAVPAADLRALRAALAPGGAFWRAHGYDELASNPYFSYCHAPLPVDARTVLGAVIERARALAARRFPRVKRAAAAEWWAHCRPHAAAHQLHFDTDNEGDAAQSCGNPIASCVLYLSGDDVGGPTLVTDMTARASSLADARGWLCTPRAGRLAVFDGALLHGVIAGRGAPAAAAPRRLTFMVAFWDTPIVAARGRTRAAAARAAGPGRPPGTEPLIACAPFPHPPPPGSAVRPWVKPFVAASDAASSPPKGSEPRVLSVPSVWEPLTPHASHGPMPGYDQCFQGA